MESRASAQFVYEKSFGSTPYDVDVTPNGAIAVVRGNTSGSTAGGSDARVSFWRTDSDSGAKLIPNIVNAVGRGTLTTLTGVATFSNAIALNNERAVIIGSRDTDSNGDEDTTYVDIVAFNYTVSPPTVTVLATHALGGGTGATTRAGLAHDVAVTPDGTLAVVTSRNWIHVFELLGGTSVAAFNVGGPASPSGAGYCDPGFARNSLELTNGRAVVAMSRLAVPAFPGYYSTWTYIIDLSWNPPSTVPTLVLEDELFPVLGDQQQKPHDLAISPDGTLAGISAFNTFGLYDLGADTFIGGHFDSSRWKDSSGCGPLWDSIELSNQRAVVLSNFPQPIIPPPPEGSCQFHLRWRAQVFEVSPSSVILKATFQDTLTPSGSNPAWDVTLADDGTLAAIKNGLSDVAILGVDSATPTLVELAGAIIGGSVWSGQVHDANSLDRMNDAVAITQDFISPSLPTDPPGVNTHRWVAYLGKFSGAFGAIDKSKVVFHDLAQVIAGNSSNPKAFTLETTGGDTWVVDLELTGSQTQVLVRSTAPPDEPDPTTGGRDWYRFQSHNTDPAATGANFGGKGVCLGVDNLTEMRGVTVSISAGNASNSGWIHVVRAL